MTLSQLPTPSPEVLAAMEQAALKEQTLKADWERYFAHRMSYDEYKFIGYLNGEMFHGRIGIERAWNSLKEYRKIHNADTKITPSSQS